MLGFIAEQLALLEIPYEFWEWTGAVPETYWVGEYLEEETDTEDGKLRSTFILTGTTRGAFLELERVKRKVERHFRHGVTTVNTDGGIAVHYSHALVIPTDTEDIKRMEINLTTTEWKVN